MPKPFLSNQRISRACELPDGSRFEVENSPTIRGDEAELSLWISAKRIALPLATMENIGDAIELLSNMESVVHDVLEFLHREALCFEPPVLVPKVNLDCAQEAPCESS